MSQDLYSCLALPFTVGRHIEVNGQYQKNVQDATFSAPYFLFLFLAFGMTLSAAGWITIDQTVPVHRWVVEVVFMIFMTVGVVNIVLFLKYLYVYTQPEQGQASLTGASARDFFMNHLGVVGLCIFYACGIVLDAFPVYAHISCMWVFVSCGTSFQHILNILFHLWRIIFKLFVVIFALNLEGRKLERRPVIRYCVFMICLPVFCNWFDYLVYNSVNEFIELQSERERFELPTHCDLLLNNTFDITNVSDFHHCMNHNTSTYIIYVHVSKSLFPFDIEFSMVAAKILADIYLCIELIPGYCNKAIGSIRVDIVSDNTPESVTVTRSGLSIVPHTRPLTEAETSYTAQTSQMTENRTSPLSKATTPGDQASLKMRQQLTEAVQEQDQQLNNTYDETTPMMSAYYHSGSETLSFGSNTRNRQNQIQSQGSYNTFENPSYASVAGTPRINNRVCRTTVVRSSTLIFPLFMLLTLVFNVALFVCAFTFADDGYKAFTVCQFIYWFPLLLSSVIGLKAIGNKFESDFTSYSGFEVLILFSMLGAFCRLYMMLYATIGCLLGSAQKTHVDDHCNDHYGQGFLTIRLLGIILDFITMILQTTLMAYMNHIKCNNTSSTSFICLKQSILYIAIANMVLWLVDSLVELADPDIRPGQKMYYGKENQWFFILHLTVPFFLFFRFNCFLIFLKTYLKFTAWTDNQTAPGSG